MNITSYGKHTASSYREQFSWKIYHHLQSLQPTMSNFHNFSREYFSALIFTVSFPCITPYSVTPSGHFHSHIFSIVTVSKAAFMLSYTLEVKRPSIKRPMYMGELGLSILKYTIFLHLCCVGKQQKKKRKTFSIYIKL